MTGQGPYLEQHALDHDVLELEADESGCRAQAHWYVLKDESALDSNSGFINSSGHVAALFQNELYESVTGRAGVARLQLFGVIFGYKRVVIYVEPTNGAVESDTARQRLLYNEQLLPWEEWASEFRRRMPEAITRLMGGRDPRPRGGGEHGRNPAASEPHQGAPAPQPVPAVAFG